MRHGYPVEALCGMGKPKGREQVIYEYPNDGVEIEAKLRGRKVLYDKDLLRSVNKIFDRVAAKKDDAIFHLTEKHDGVRVDAIQVSKEYITRCCTMIPKSLHTAITHARSNIEEVNRYFLPEREKTVQLSAGKKVGEKISPLESVALWVPARKVPLISTALMLVCAAKVAGVQRICVGMPPDKNGSANAATVAASKIAGAHEIYVGNGVGLIAAFTLGTNTIPEVDGIFGPGPGGIAAAMSIAYSHGKKTVLGIGPTDCAILCDDSADPRLLAYDLVNEAEHGADSSAILVTTSRRIAEQTEKELEYIVSTFGDQTRKAVLQKVFSESGYGAIVLCDGMDDAVGLVNDFAPEHLMIQCGNHNEIAREIRNAAEILIGPYTPFSAANYAIGVTAVLPTNGYARWVSGVTAKDMVKVSTTAELTRDALAELLPTIEEIGKRENLPGHVLAARKRFADRNAT